MKTKSKKKIAFVFLGSGTTGLIGGGGAERRFSKCFDEYNTKGGLYELDFIIDEESYELFKEIGIFKQQKNLFISKTFVPNNFFNKLIKYFYTTFVLMRYSITNKPDLLHFIIPSIQYVPFIKILNILPIRKPKLAITIVNCAIAQHYEDGSIYNKFDIYRYFIEKVELNGIFTYYKNIKELIPKVSLINKDTKVFCIASGFTDLKKFNVSPKKENIVIFAARLEEQKRPLFFLEAVKQLKERNLVLYNKWQYKMFGKGELETKVKKYVQKNNINEVVVTSNKDMSKEFSKSKVFVSTQDFENFPSMSMIEAMASGNAILSRDVGQTNIFVKNGLNGLLLQEDTPNSLSINLEYLLSNEQMVKKMGIESRELVEKNHTIEKFIYELEEFWRSVLIK